ncbi:MFS transporter [Nonomuraea rhodomycinica]|uniref:MFS transporter n=1 Tax=Nonomuraea rhodomycinica TaxID=1712872 RepID=A0A7Y6IP48_9ACTN|nr:MFS transporter [Nonomuraea rhodomycinica]NUW40494.1 MFS transporter [Nonomuraea rhodomycinica]
MCAGMFLVLLDVTIVNIALPSVGARMGGGQVADLQWVVDGYQLTLAGLLLAGGTLGDRYGHRRVVVAGFALFGAASAGCALAPGIGLLVAARVVQGMGAALLLPGTLAVISRLHPDQESRARAIGAWAASGSLALPAGPLLGGALVQFLGWPWVFWINVPAIAVIIPVILVVAGESEPLDRPLDVPGVVLGTATLALLVLTVIEAGRLGLGDPLVLAAGALTVACGAGFAAAERRARHPMLPPALLRRRPIAVSTVAAAAMNFGLNGVMLLFTLYLQIVRNLTAVVAGVSLLPLFVPLVLLPAYAGRVAGRRGPRPVMLAGLGLLVAGFALLPTLRPAAGAWAPAVVMAVMGAGAALLTPSVVALAMGAAPPGREGLTSALNNTARQAGGAVGVAVLGAVAGSPSDAGAFVAGMRHAAIIAVVVYLVVIALTLTARAEPAPA